MPVIPERSPVGDSVQGAVIRCASADASPNATVSDAIALVADAQYGVLPTGCTMLAQGALMVRYGVRFLEKPAYSLVPGLLALDYGEMLTGEDAWDFLIHKSNLYPRADVVGYRSDGEDSMMPVKRLDLALPFEVLVYADAQAVIPVAPVSALIVPETLPEDQRMMLPPRLLEALPVHRSIRAWLETQHPPDAGDAAGNAADDPQQP